MTGMSNAKLILVVVAELKPWENPFQKQAMIFIGKEQSLERVQKEDSDIMLIMPFVFDFESIIICLYFTNFYVKLKYKLIALKIL